jgi:hypothetical protein
MSIRIQHKIRIKAIKVNPLAAKLRAKQSKLQRLIEQRTVENKLFLHDAKRP